VVVSEIHNEELAAFVTSTLNAIAYGTADAAQVGTWRFEIPKEVEFEVAVTATRSKEAGGGLRIQVFSAEGKARSENEHISKIRFSVSKVNAANAGPLDLKHLRKGIV
jgi:hypothetical protein